MYIRILVVVFFIQLCTGILLAQTLFVPDGTNGIGDNTTNGYVGIGVSSPSTQLSIQGSAPEILLGAPTGSLNVGANIYPGLVIVSNANSGPTSFLNTAYGGIYTTATTTGSYPFNSAGNLIIQSRGNESRDISFVTGVTPNVRMIIGWNGNVGIGTTQPTQKLDLRGNMQIINDDQSSYIYMADPSSGSTMSYFSMGIKSSDRTYRINRGNTPGNYNDITIKYSNGNVGIGTDNPQSKLSIQGVYYDSRIHLHSTGYGDGHEADLMLWACEPNLTYTGVGVGNNIWNSPTQDAITRLNTARGGSYMRLLESEIRLNVVSNTGTDVNAIFVKSDANVGIGTTTPGTYKLAVNGKIGAEEIEVIQNIPDYVFEEDYNLRSLEEVETFINANKHLPDIPSAKDFEGKAVAVGEMQVKHLQKIEELTLYIIEQNKKIQQLEERLAKVESQK